ncbi:hypothetical protein BDR05DRAFT_956986 [Suillus weaverae]|nr:hypothetical protein BDR05DRAFT_956986 [Suillus weaverae]
MFAVRFAILALLTFLAGANAGCDSPTCQEIFEVGDAVYILLKCMRSGDGFTVCIYEGSIKEDEAECEYSDKDGSLVAGDSVCPKTSKVDPSELGF